MFAESNLLVPPQQVHSKGLQCKVFLRKGLAVVGLIFSYELPVSGFEGAKSYERRAMRKCRDLSVQVRGLRVEERGFWTAQSD